MPGSNVIMDPNKISKQNSPRSPGRHSNANSSTKNLEHHAKVHKTPEPNKEEDVVIVVPKKWLIVKKNLQRILEYGHRENLIGDKNDDSTNQGNADNSNNNQNNANEKENEKKDEDVIKVLTEDISLAHSAIPFLPVPMAILCLVLNVCLPGIGTICSGFATICLGQPRLGYTEGRVFMSIVINFLVGVAQLITITFMFVGWFWSVAWGGLLLMHSLEYRHALMQKRQEAVATAAIEALTKDAILRKRDVQNLVQTNKASKNEQRRHSSLVQTLENKLKRKSHK